MNEEVTQITLREQLESAFDKHQEPKNNLVVKGIPTGDTVIGNASYTENPPISNKPRDEHGKFSKADVQVDDKTAPANAVDISTESATPAVQRPTTWKKEHLPLWDKIASGQPLTDVEAKQLASYTTQRENEYKNGVSTYKAEAENARHLQEAMAPFMPDLQRHNINPIDWIKNLGNAHRTLAMGSAEQKLQMFQQLAHDYGIPLGAVSQAQQGGIDPTVMALLDKIQKLESGVSEVATWRQQQEQQAIQGEIAKYQDAEKYPHFELVRGNMAQLLQSGSAQDLQTAYDMAAKPIEDLIASRLSKVQPQQLNVQAAQEAKAKAISPKSSTPRGKVTAPQAKDLRAQLEDAFDRHAGRV